MIRALLFVVVLFTSSCKENSVQESTVNASNINPLKINNQWVYQVKGTSSKTPNDTAIWFDTTTIIRDTIIAEEKWYIQKRNNSSYLTIMTIRKDGLWIMDDTNTPNLNAKYPALLNDTYGNTIVKSIDTVVSVPSGKYSCYMYSFADSGSMGATYYSPNIGLVKEYALVNWSATEKKYFQWNLVSKIIN